MEMNTSFMAVVYTPFFSLRVYSCRMKGCTFKLQAAVLCEIASESNEIPEKIVGLDRFLCFIAHVNDHAIWSGRCFNSHDVGKVNKQINWDHNI
jgi:hypothetical protein